MRRPRPGGPDPAFFPGGGVERLGSPSTNSAHLVPLRLRVIASVYGGRRVVCMTGWSVDVDGVGAVIAATGQAADAVGSAIAVALTALRTSSSGAGSAIIGAALAGYVGDRTDEFEYAVTQPSAMLHAAIEVTAVYVEADIHMGFHAEGPGSDLPRPGLQRSASGWRFE